MGRRERKKELTRGMILDAAAELFGKKGYNATSIDDIVQSADLVKGTFYYHFRSKEDLVLELRRQTLVRDLEHVDTALAAGASPLRVIVELFAKDAEWTERNTDMARVFFSQLFGGFLGKETEMSGESSPGVVDPLVAVVEAAQKAGELRNDLSATQLADMLMGVLGHAQFTWLLSDRSESLVARVRSWILISLEGLCDQTPIGNAQRSALGGRDR